MILIDGSNTSTRTFHSCVNIVLEGLKSEMLLNPETRPNSMQMKELMTMYLTFSVEEILNLKKKYENTYSEIVVVFDSNSNSWRRRHYERYKSNRRKAKKTKYDKLLSSIHWKLIPHFINILKACKIKVFHDLYTDDKYSIEGDDIIATLVMKNPTEKHLIVSVDSDFKQLALKYQVRQYHPLKRLLMDKPTKKAIELWKLITCTAGQQKDGIPNIKQESVLDSKFIEWCKEKYDLDIDNTMLEKIENEHQDLIKQYETEMVKEDLILIEEGKRKQRRNLTVYKKERMGEKGALEFIKDLDNNLKLNHRYKRNFKRNKKLMLFELIDEDVRNIILDEYEKLNKQDKFINTVEIMSLFNKYSLPKLIERLNEF